MMNFKLDVALHGTIWGSRSRFLSADGATHFYGLGNTEMVVWCSLMMQHHSTVSFIPRKVVVTMNSIGPIPKAFVSEVVYMVRVQ